jgi:hypothetical protein
MTRTPIEYSKCCFYRLVCRDPMVTECYVGRTTDEVKRRSCHKSRCNDETRKSFNCFVYRFIRDHGGFENWQMIVHEHLAVKDRVSASLRERYWVEFYQSTLNQKLPGRSKAESTAAWHVNHREVQNQKSASYKLANEDRLKTKHTCECGGCYTTTNYRQHIKSKKHIAFEAK